MSETVKDLRDWLRDSVRDGYLFGCHDEPLDDAGKRIVRAIVDRLEAPAASPAAFSGAAPQEPSLKPGAYEKALRDFDAHIAPPERPTPAAGAQE